MASAYRFLASRLVPGLRHAQRAYLDRLEAGIPGQRWLDLGCGHCLIPPWMRGDAEEESQLVGSAKRAVGVDPCRDSVARHGSLPETHVAAAESLPFEDGAFDLVTANMVMEHLPDPVAALREVRRVLAEGGRAVLHTPNFDYPPMRALPAMPQSLKDALAQLLERRERQDVFPTYYRFNRSRDIERAARAAGFEHVEIEAVESVPITWRLGPLASAELLLMRWLRRERRRHLQANLIVTLHAGVASDACVTPPAVPAAAARSFAA